MASTARLEELKKKFDENQRRYFAPLANEHRKSGDLEQAISLCRAHLPQQPAHISGHIVLAQALFEAGQVDESRTIFQAALEIDPENLIALRYLGDIARTIGDISTARSWYQRVLEVDPRNDEIGQLVRELDAPTPMSDALDAPAPEPVSAASSAPPPVPQMSSAERDARFAPLSLEQIDVAGELLGTSNMDAAGETHAVNDISADAVGGADEAFEDSPELAFDVHAAWNTDSPTTEIPMLDTPDLDPFDMAPSGSAESLFEADADAAAGADLLMSELSGIGSDPEPEPISASNDDDVTASWPSADAEPARGEPASGEPSMAEFDVDESDVVIEAAAETPTPFEEAAFYLEAAEPSEATAKTSEPAGTTTFAEAPAATDVERVEVEMSVEAYAPDETEMVESAAISDELEVEAREPEVTAAADADPVFGHTPELASSEHGAIPAAFVTETMAELYLQQGFRNEALSVYRELLARNPEDESLRERVEQIESGSMSSIGMATLSENVVESALKRQNARPARSVRSFFASLASRRVPERPAADTAEAGKSDEAQPFSPYEPLDEVPGVEALAPASASPEEAAGSASDTPRVSARSLMADFDPFEMDSAEPPAAPSATPEESEWPSSPNVEPSGDGRAEAARGEPTSARSLNELFPDEPAAPRAEAAAQTLATAFGRTEPQGRPTRAASNELSLDHVFRGAPEGTPAPDGGFSFDQFFSDSRSGGSDVAAAPAASPPGNGHSSGGGDTNDIEQFTAWLEGLKKK